MVRLTLYLILYMLKVWNSTLGAHLLKIQAAQNERNMSPNFNQIEIGPTIRLII